MNKYNDVGDLYRANLSASKEPSPDVWKGIKRKLKRRDFWRVKGKFITLALILVPVFIFAYLSREDGENVQVENLSRDSNIVIHNSKLFGKENIFRAFVIDEEPMPESEAVFEMEHNSKKVKREKPETEVEIHEEKAAVLLSQDDLSEIKRETDPNIDVPEEFLLSRPVSKSVQGVTVENKIVSEQQNINSDNIEKCSDFKETKAKTEIIINLPTAFTPNGDGLNDEFYPKIYGHVNSYIFRIYDRNNSMLFQTSQVEEAWDGSFRGKQMPRGRYIYVITYTDEKGLRCTKKGEFLLID